MRWVMGTILVMLAVGLAAAAMQEQNSTPSTQPTTQLATTGPTTSVSGTVDYQGGLSLRKPDLTRVVIYLASDPVLDSLPVQSMPYVVAQHNRAFVPHFIVIPKGAKVDFPNWDHFYHNVFSRSAAAPAFDLDRYPYGYSKTRTFDKVGVVQIFCNIHPYMRSIIVVTPNVCFARAHADGHFNLTGVPIGHYQIVAWNDRCDEEKQAVDVGAAGLNSVVLHLHESRDAIINNDAPNHESDYGVDRGLGVKREHLGLPVVPDVHPATETPPAN
jgi:plastocyanin